LPKLDSQEEIKEVLSNFSQDETEIEEIANYCPSVAIKDLILITEMAKQKGKGHLKKDNFIT